MQAYLDLISSDANTFSDELFLDAVRIAHFPVDVIEELKLVACVTEPLSLRWRCDRSWWKRKL